MGKKSAFEEVSEELEEIGYEKPELKPEEDLTWANIEKNSEIKGDDYD